MYQLHTVDFLAADRSERLTSADDGFEGTYISVPSLSLFTGHDKFNSLTSLSIVPNC